MLQSKAYPLPIENKLQYVRHLQNSRLFSVVSSVCNYLDCKTSETSFKTETNRHSYHPYPDEVVDPKIAEIIAVALRRLQRCMQGLHKKSEPTFGLSAWWLCDFTALMSR